MKPINGWKKNLFWKIFRMIRKLLTPAIRNGG
jgi:hypothetical protein